MKLSNIVSDLIDKIILELKKDKNMEKIETNFINPLIGYTFKKIYPYVALAFFVFLLILILAILILLFQIKQLNNLNKTTE